MQTHTRISLRTLHDPFILLKICRLLREIGGGETIEILVESGSIPDELAKIFSSELYRITTRQAEKTSGCLEVLIQKRKTPLGSILSSAKRGRCCS